MHFPRPPLTECSLHSEEDVSTVSHVVQGRKRLIPRETTFRVSTTLVFQVKDFCTWTVYQVDKPPPAWESHPGSHLSQNIDMVIPDLEGRDRRVYLVLRIDTKDEGVTWRIVNNLDGFWGSLRVSALTSILELSRYRF